MEVPRLVEERLISELDKPTITILLGPRQVGKSVLLRRLQAVAQSRGKSTAFYDLERPEQLRLMNETDEALIALLESSGDVVFVDEFQYLKNATRLFKILVDSRKPVKLVASGSSSIDIHTHLKESLAGRFRTFLIHPLVWNGERAAVPGATWIDYLRFGGMPGLVHETSENDKMELLSNLVSTYLLKDVRALLLEENIRAFNALLYFLAQNQGSVISTAALAREIRLSEPAVNRYLDILHQTYTVFPLGSYSRNLANELKKSRKYYVYDLGIRNLLIKDFSPLPQRSDGGIIVESLVEAALRRRLRVNETLHFWRTKQGDEVDFILSRDRQPLPIEVKQSFHGEKNLKGIDKFLAAYPDAPGAYVFTLDGPKLSDPRVFFERAGRKIRLLHAQAAEDLDLFFDLLHAR